MNPLLKAIAGVFLCIGFCCSNALALTEPVKIGNPGSAQFPIDDPEDCYARSVWDMHYYNGSIYVGTGDCLCNRGPIVLWSFDEGGFTEECTVAEEQIYLFRSYDGKLLIPGMDTTESWDYGNIYIKDGAMWEKLRTIPGGLHVFDAAVFEGNLYVVVSSNGYSALMKSTDIGQTWEPLMVIDWNDGFASFGEMVALDDALIIMGTTPDWEPCIYRYADGSMEALVIPIRPCMSYGIPGRCIGFRDGILYTAGYSPSSVEWPAPLFFLNDFTSGAVSIEEFRGKAVRDIVVRDSTCYVLTATEVDDTFQGYIHSSSDLTNWTKEADFTVPALPYSFELLDGIFYVGLGNRSCWWGYADTESGSIYRLDKLLQAKADFSPDKWNLEWARSSTGKGTVLCLIGSPTAGDETLDVSDIDISSIRLNGSIPCQANWNILTRKQDFTGSVLGVRFEKGDAVRSLGSVSGGDRIAVKVTGDLKSGGRFEATHAVKIIGSQFAAPQQAALSTALHPSYPNPSNPETWIPYQLAEDVDVEVRIYNAIGQIIRTLELGHRAAGSYISRDKAAYWDGRDESGESVASGLYFYIIDAGGFRDIRRMTVIR
jgi:hypothetical protein